MVGHHFHPETVNLLTALQSKLRWNILILLRPLLLTMDHNSLSMRQIIICYAWGDNFIALSVCKIIVYDDIGMGRNEDVFMPSVCKHRQYCRSSAGLGEFFTLFMLSVIASWVVCVQGRSLVPMLALKKTYFKAKSAVSMKLLVLCNFLYIDVSVTSFYLPQW